MQIPDKKDGQGTSEEEQKYACAYKEWEATRFNLPFGQQRGTLD